MVFEQRKTSRIPSVLKIRNFLSMESRNYATSKSMDDTLARKWCIFFQIAHNWDLKKLIIVNLKIIARYHIKIVILSEEDRLKILKKQN